MLTCPMKHSYLLLLPMMACAPGNPSHLPNPLTLPFDLIQNGISNSVYDARRGNVSDHVVSNFDTILSEIPSGKRPLLNDAMDLANISSADQKTLLQEFRDNPDIYQTNDPEPLIVALMVYGN